MDAQEVQDMARRWARGKVGWGEGALDVHTVMIREGVGRLGGGMEGGGAKGLEQAELCRYMKCVNMCVK